MPGLLGDALSLRRCPRCGAQQPAFRVPQGARQWAVGGWTCRTCGTELDRFGRRLADHPEPSPYRYLTATSRGGYGLAVAGVVIVGLAALELWVGALVVAILVAAFGAVVVALGLTSARTHRRSPVERDGDAT